MAELVLHPPRWSPHVCFLASSAREVSESKQWSWSRNNLGELSYCYHAFSEVFMALHVGLRCPHQVGA